MNRRDADSSIDHNTAARTLNPVTLVRIQPGQLSLPLGRGPGTGAA
jgi:hypothetical protein